MRVHTHTHTRARLGTRCAALPDPCAVPSWPCLHPTAAPGRHGAAPFHARGISLPAAPKGAPCRGCRSPSAGEGDAAFWPAPPGPCPAGGPARLSPGGFPAFLACGPAGAGRNLPGCSGCMLTARLRLSHPQRATGSGPAVAEGLAVAPWGAAGTGTGIGTGTGVGAGVGPDPVGACPGPEQWRGGNAWCWGREAAAG